MSDGMVVAVTEASLVVSYLLNESRDGKDWTALESVSIYVPLRSKWCYSETINPFRVGEPENNYKTKLISQSGRFSVETE